jgi:glycosyltransferase involved in cell wall biosynthesis
MLGAGASIKVIPNPVPLGGTCAHLEREAIVLAVGRHYDVKGLDRAIRAFSAVDAPEWQLHIAGSEGPATQDLVKLVGELNLRDRVVFLGPVKDMRRVYCRSSIFVLPSRSEGFPNALIEAMAHGLACVSFDINAGPSEIIQNGHNGVLVEDDDIPALAAAIQTLINNETDRRHLGRRALEIRERLALPRIGDEFIDFITSSRARS